MKLTIIFAFFTIAFAFSSCTKCQTCVPHYYSLGTIGAADKNAQAIKLCDKTDINAYESLTSFQDAYRDTVRYICN